MIISQVLLSAFVISWLSKQYKEEKSLLKKELIDIYVSSREDVLDTILVRQVIMPTLTGDSIMEITKPLLGMTGHNVSDSIEMNFFIDTEDSEHPKAQLTTISINAAPDSIISSGSKEKEEEFFRGLNNILVRSTKLFMFESSDTLEAGSTLKVVLRDMIDSSLFMQAFDKKILEERSELTFSWVHMKHHDSLREKSGEFLIYEQLSDKLPAVRPENYQWLLIAAIWPQLVFALVLLLLTALSFYLSYISLRKQVALNQIRNDFVSNLTHELKTPVSTVKVALESLQRFDILKDKERTKDYLEMSSKEIHRLDSLISKVLNHVLLESNSGLVNPELLNLKELTEEVIARFSNRTENLKAKISINIEADIYLSADRLLCQGIIHNLLDNSLKYSDKNPEIGISAHTAGNKILIEFSDNGPGIPEKHLGSIFEKFFRVPAFNKHNVKGHGLGLSYVDLVMKAHKGKVQVRNRKQHGCTFTLEFPAE